ncbi:MAG: hypothetical protein HY005_03600 [Candidatus Staskawiczbacteria bacterium]|nr:hypothetical protein [Candidatus Staskawiczbacteria bacterium]
MKIIDMTKILSENKSGWIAISPKDNKLVAKGKTLKKVLQESSKKGIEKPIVFKSAPVNTIFAG